MVVSALSSRRASGAPPLPPGNFKHRSETPNRSKLSTRRKRSAAGSPSASKIEGDDVDVGRALLRRLPRSLAFHVASDSASLRSAASLRAHAFASNLPSTVSEFSRQAYVRERAKDAWSALEDRQRGVDPDYRACSCACLVGTIDDRFSATAAAIELDNARVLEEEEEEEYIELSRAVREAGDASATLAPLGGSRRRRLAVASLDVIVGRRLPSESLVAECHTPEIGDGECRVAYFANVAVAPPARRRGIGVALLSHAIEHVATCPSLPPVLRIAVHAEARNAAARALYEHSSLGFSLERAEGAAVEKALGRPRRVLYSRAL